MELSERLQQCIDRIKEDYGEIVSEIEKVRKTINKESHLDKSTVSCYKAMLNCCKTGKFIPSSELDKSLIDWGKEFVMGVIESESTEEIKKAIKTLYEEDGIETFYDEMLTYIDSHSKLYDIWCEGLSYIDNKLWNRMCNKVKANL